MKKFFLLSLLLTIFILPIFVVPAYATARYSPGETLNPDCLPTDSTCTVSLVLTYNSVADMLTPATSTSGLIINGNFGLGTSTPQAKLSLVGASTSPLFLASDQGTLSDYRLYQEQISADGGATIFNVLSTKSIVEIPAEDFTFSGVSMKDSLILTPSGDLSLIGANSSDPNDIGILLASSDFGTSSTIGFNTVSGLTSFTSIGDYSFGSDGVSKVGIGTTSPAYELDVNGDINFTGTLLQNGTAFSIGTSSQWTSASNNIYYNTGNIGLGTSSPIEKLHIVDGNLRLDNGSILQGNPDDSSIVKVSGETVIMPSKARAVQVVGNYAYLATYATSSGGSFRVVDISNINHPFMLSGANLANMPAAPSKGIVVIGSYAYLGIETSTSTDVFRIIDISNPSNPVVVGGQDLAITTVGVPSSIAVNGHYAYIGHGTGAITAVDVSNPRKPFVVSEFGSITGDAVWSLKVYGKYLYVGRHLDASLSNNNLEIWDVSDPLHPVRKSAVNIAGDSVWGLDVVGHYVYLAIGAFGGAVGNNFFRIVDVSDPVNPVAIGGDNLSGYQSANYVRVYGKYAYLTNWQGELNIIDTSSSTNPVLLVTKGITDVSGSSNTYGPLTFNLVGRYLVTGYAPTGPETWPSANSFRIWDVSGIEAMAANIHNLEAGNINVKNGVTVTGVLNVLDSINLGVNGLYSAGSLISEKIFSTSTFNYITGMSSSIFAPASNLLLGTTSTTNLSIGVYGYATSTDYGLTGDIRGIGLAGSGDYRGVYGYSPTGYGGYFLTDSGTGLVVENRNSAGIALSVLGTTSISSLDQNGAVYSFGTVLTNTSPSSREYKDNIATTTLNIDALLGLQVQSYNWKNNGRLDFGLIAEEVKDALPELYLDDGTTKGYRADHLPFYLLQIAQRQAKQIADLGANFVSGVGTVFEKVTALVGSFGKIKVDQGIEMKDEATGEIYCLTISSGDWKKVKGECAQLDITPTPSVSALVSSDSPGTDDSNSASTTSEVTDTSSTTVTETVATTTEAVIPATDSSDDSSGNNSTQNTESDTSQTSSQGSTEELNPITDQSNQVETPAEAPVVPVVENSVGNNE